MNFEMFGSGCFGTVIGYVSWNVAFSQSNVLDVKGLAAFIGALLGAAVLAVFPAGTTLFAAYACGLSVGFFAQPILKWTFAIAKDKQQQHGGAQPPSGSLVFPSVPATSEEAPAPKDEMDEIDKNWVEVEPVILHLLERKYPGSVTLGDLGALTYDDAGKVLALRKYARLHPKEVRIAKDHRGWIVQKL